MRILRKQLAKFQVCAYFVEWFKTLESYAPILSLFETWLPSTSDMKAKGCSWQWRVYNPPLSQPDSSTHNIAFNNKLSSTFIFKAVNISKTEAFLLNDPSAFKSTRTTAKIVCRWIPLAWRQKVWVGWSRTGFWGFSIGGRVKKRQRAGRGACLPIQKETAQQQKRNILLRPPGSECVDHAPQMEQLENKSVQGFWALDQEKVQLMADLQAPEHVGSFLHHVESRIAVHGLSSCGMQAYLFCGV